MAVLETLYCLQWPIYIINPVDGTMQYLPPTQNHSFLLEIVLLPPPPPIIVNCKHLATTKQDMKLKRQFIINYRKSTIITLMPDNNHAKSYIQKMAVELHSIPALAFIF